MSEPPEGNDRLDGLGLPLRAAEARAAGLQPAIVTEGVVKSYPGSHFKALDGLDLTVARGEFVAVTGPSGCGKSTLLSLLAALDTPDSGRIVVNDHDLATIRDLNSFRRSEVGLVFQLHNLLPNLSVLANIEVAMIGTHRSRKEQRARALDLLDNADLLGRENRRPTELSGGERQRVAVCRALANDPAVLLADEPTGNLDESSIDRLLTWLQRLRSERSLTILLVTHDVAVGRAADRVVLMAAGRIVTSRTTSPAASAVPS